MLNGYYIKCNFIVFEIGLMCAESADIMTSIHGKLPISTETCTPKILLQLL